MSKPKLDEEAFIKWFKENSPHIGKGKTMKAICKAFPESVIMVKQTYHPFDFAEYSTQAAIIMNRLKDEGKIKSYKKGNAFCYKWIEGEEEEQPFRLL